MWRVVSMKQIDGGKVETVSDFIFLVSRFNVDNDCSHKLKRLLLLGWIAVTKLDSALKNRDITLTTKAMVFPVVIYGCELDHKVAWASKNECFRTVVLEKTIESPLNCKVIKQVNLKRNQSWIFIGRTDTEAEAPRLWPSDAKSWLTGKDPNPGKDWGQEEKGVTEDQMVGWHHWLKGHESE